MILEKPERVADYTARGWWGTRTLDDLFRENVEKSPDSLAAVDPPNRAGLAPGEPLRLTYAELDAATDRLANALTKAHKLTIKQAREIHQARAEPQARPHISVHLRGNIRLVPVQDILYFMADSKYVTVRTTNEEHLIEDSLVNLEKEFGEKVFLRIHRNALVATDYIKGIEKSTTGNWQVALTGLEKKLDVSRRHAAAVRRWARR